MYVVRVCEYVSELYALLVALHLRQLAQQLLSWFFILFCRLRGRHSCLHHVHAALFLDAPVQRRVQPPDVDQHAAALLLHVHVLVCLHCCQHHGDAPCGRNLYLVGTIERQIH